MPTKRKATKRAVKVTHKAARKSHRSKTATLKPALKFGKLKASTWVTALALIGGTVGAVLVLSARAVLNDSTTPLPPSDVVLCKQAKYYSNGLSKTDYDWLVAYNNDSRYCQMQWDSQNNSINPLGLGKIYNLTDGQPIVLNQTVTAGKTKTTDTVQGDDAIVPTYPNGSGLPGIYIGCMNAQGVNNDFSGTENQIKFDVRLRNTGSTTWKASDGYALIVPPGNTSFGATKLDLIDRYTDPNNNTVKDVAPGEEIVLRASLTLPPQNGYYSMFWMMAKNNNVFGSIVRCDFRRFVSGLPGGFFQQSGTYISPNSDKPANAPRPVKSSINPNSPWGSLPSRAQ